MINAKIFKFFSCYRFLFSFKQLNELFQGEIVYVYSATDLNGVDKTLECEKIMGKEQHYFINSNNYKTLNELDVLTSVFNGSSNKLHFFSNGKSLATIYASMDINKSYKILKLDEKIKLLGYDCDALEVVTENDKTVYYYSQKLKANLKTFEKHNYGGWFKYLTSSNGALPLKYVITNQKMNMIITATAKQIKSLKLEQKDFDLP